MGSYSDTPYTPLNIFTFLVFNVFTHFLYILVLETGIEMDFLKCHLLGV